MKKDTLNYLVISSASVLAAIIFLLWPPKASAQAGGPAPDGPMTQDVEIMLGAMGLRSPAYSGSDDLKTRALPIINARWRSGWFAGVGGVGFRFGGDSPLTGGLSLSFDLGRKESDSEDLRGMGDIRVRPEIVGFASYRFFPGLGLSSSLRYGSGNDRDGLIGDIGLRGMVPISESHRIFYGLTTSFANQAAMRSQFGVTQAQSLTSGYSVYEPGAGLRDVSLNIGHGMSITPDLMLILGVTERRLLGDAKDSPLTRKVNAASANLGLSYRW